MYKIYLISGILILSSFSYAQYHGLSVFGANAIGGSGTGRGGYGTVYHK